MVKIANKIMRYLKIEHIKMQKVKIVTIITSLLLSFGLYIQPSFAGGVDDLMKFASPKGSMVNVNKAGVVRDQQAGYVTGGSVILRGPRPKTLQPLSIQTPKMAFNACTGSADFRFGGLSYVSGKEFTDFFKNTATAAGSYAVKMLIKNACPQCEDIMSYIETVARDVNGTMMDQCAMAEMIGGGLYNALNSSGQQQCLMNGNVDKSNKDMFEASEKCKADPDRHGNKGDDDEFESLLGNEFNLVWKALGKGDSGSLDFKELMMSVSGTIIGRKVDNRFQFKQKPSLVLSTDLLERYIGSKKGAEKVKLYKCDEKHKCLNPDEVEVNFTDQDTIYGNISRILEKIIPKVRSGKDELTDEEQSVIAFSSVPILRLIEMEISQKTNPEDTILRMNEFIEVVCYDVVTTFMDQMISEVTAKVQALEYSQLDDSVIKNFTSQISDVRKFVSTSKFTAFKRLELIMQYQARITQQVRSFKAGFGQYLEHNLDC